MTDLRGRTEPPPGARFHWEDVADEHRVVRGRKSPDARAPRPQRRRRAGIEPLGYQPALDGLRAVAVAAVLLYHARFEWIPGGFLGVSAFFTLSGFLITSLLLREHFRPEGVALRRFWGRRFRRLLPASWTTIGAILVMGALGAWSVDQLRALRSDVPFALAEVLNWHFIAAERTYGDSFAAPSPLEHFWSLAVEQQFYVLLPLVVMGALALTRRGPASGGRGLVPLVGVLAVLGIASAVANGVLAEGSVDRAYFGTDTRMAEMIAGALLACAMLRGLRLRGRLLRRLWPVLAIAAVAVTVWLWHVATVDSSLMYPWGFLLTAAATVALIVGALQPGPLAAVLAWAPLVWIGRISYGIYLLHWPVFLWLTPARTGWSSVPLFGLRVAVTVTAAFVMFRLIEQPLRLGRLVQAPRGAALAAVSVVALVGGNLLLTDDLPAPSVLEQASAREAPAPPPPPPVDVLVLGDELAATLQPVQGEEVEGLSVTSAPAASCGLTVGGYVQLADGRVERDPDRCATVRDAWNAAVVQNRPDVVVLWGGIRDMANRRLGVDQHQWVPSTDPSVMDFQRAELTDLVEDLKASGSQVVLLTVPQLASQLIPGPTPPPVRSSDPQRAQLAGTQDALAAQDAPPPSHTENDPARIAAWNALLVEIAATQGADLIDLAAHLRTQPGGELSQDLREAGLGLNPTGRALVLEWLEPQLREIADRTAPPPAPQVAAQAQLPPAPPATPRRTAAPGTTARVMVAGDSVAYNFATGLKSFADGGGDLRATNVAQLGCPVARGGDFRFLRDFNTFPARCDWSATFPGWLAENDPHVVLFTSGIWEVVDRKLPGDTRWRHIGQPEIDDYLLRELLAAIDVLGSKGATVVLATYPHFDAGQDQGFTGLPESEPARVDRLNEILRQAASLRPGVVAIVEFQAWLAAQPGGEIDPLKRDDGLHFRDEYLPVIGEWLGPQLVDLARNGPPPTPPSTGG